MNREAMLEAQMKEMAAQQCSSNQAYGYPAPLVNGRPTTYSPGLPQAPIKEPGLMARVEELLKHLAALQGNVDQIEEALNGPMLNQVDDAIAGQSQNNRMRSLADLIASACTQAACLCGQTGTILSRM